MRRVVSYFTMVFGLSPDSNRVFEGRTPEAPVMSDRVGCRLTRV